MRNVLVACLLLSALLAGCGDSGKDAPAQVSPLKPSDVILPSPGLPTIMEDIEGGVAAIYTDVELPMAVDIVVPAKATMIRAVADSGATSVSMSNAETGRRRCNNPTVEDFSSGFGYPKSCSSITALDAPSATWHVTFNAPVPAASTVPGQPADPPVRGNVSIEFLDLPYDGLLAGLDLAGIDKPTRDLEPTVVEFLPSHDGVLLRTERTLPQGDGPFPAIIVSSPYYDDGVRATPADWTYVVQDWAKRGYAMVTADVRGFGDSGGCVEVWGINEQLDQKFLVDWVASQPWSDGNVGFYGQSYVGTTPVEAAVQAPAALKAIVTIAPVINAYEDWHYGGVPNGESELSPVAYQVLTEAAANDPTYVLNEQFDPDPQQIANNAGNGPCDPTLVPQANDPRATYNAFYEERNFKLRAKDVTAAVLYTEGFEDANVKSAMIPGWFNELQSPKLGLFGHWLHQHPSRLDCEALFVGWFETHLKGKDLGFDSLPAAAIQVDRDTQRSATEWPPNGAALVASSFGADLAAGTLAEGPAGTDTSVTLTLDHAGAGLGTADMPDSITLRGTLERDVSLAGVANVRFHGVLAGTNAYVGAYLYEGDRLVSWGQLNLAHNEDHTQYNPNVPPADMTRSIPLRPTEDLLRSGSELRLVLRAVQAAEATDPFGVTAAYLNIDEVALDLPGVALADYEPISLTARP